MHSLVTGGAGFIGSHLCDSLAAHDHKITILDNLSTGAIANISHLIKRHPKNVKLLRGDCTNPKHMKKALKDAEILFHLAANPEVRLELNDPDACFQQNIFATQIVLQQAKDTPNIHTIVFASTSTVYGEPKAMPTPEDYGPLAPISLYGASKLAGEALVSAYAHTYDKNAAILRLANIVGPRSQHGVIHDFLRKLRLNPAELEILGDGTQNKSYLFIDDCVNAIELACREAGKEVETFNVGSEDQVSVVRIAEILVEEMGLKGVKYSFKACEEGGRGWKGDVKNMLLDITKLKTKGWKPKFECAEAIRKTVRHLLARRIAT